MPDTTYIDYTTPAVSATWLNEVNDHIWHDTPVTNTTVHNSTAIKFVQTGTGATNRTVSTKLQEFVSAKDFGATGSGSDETATVQLAVNSLGVDGGKVSIPRGVKFNLKSLIFPIRCNLEYFADDDLSNGATQDIGTNELVLFAANANAGGIVNEWRYTAAFHPGLMIDVRKDVHGQDASLGGGQSRTNPARASLNIHDEQVDSFRIVYENYTDYSIFTGTQIHSWRRVLSLNGIGTAQWITPPVANTLVRGATSGARGVVIRTDTSPVRTLVHWIAGTFAVGEKLIDDNETTSATLTSISSMTLQANQPLSTSPYTGAWSIGLGPGSVIDTFGVGGQITTASTRDMGQYYGVTTQMPAFNLIDSYEGATNGYKIFYDTTPAAANRRVTLRRYGSTVDRGHIGAIAAHASVGDNGSVAVLRSGSFNINSVTRNGGTVGRYDVVFSAPTQTANYRVLTGSQFAGHITWDLKTINGFSFFISNATGTAQWAPFDFDFSVIGGDI